MNILWQQPNGNLALTSIFDGSDPKEHAELRLERGDIPADWKLLATEVDWPETGWQHEAHRWDGYKIVVDLGAAKEVTKARLRVQRAPLLAVQDVAFMQALEQGADTKAIAAEKQRLRDITLLADRAKTLNELAALSC